MRALAAATVILALTPGCATILKGSTPWGQVQFRDTPKADAPDQNLQVWVNGQPKAWKYEFSSIRSRGGRDEVKSEPTIDLTTTQSHQVRARVKGCEVEFQVSPSVNGWWVVADIFLGLGIGVIVDAITGEWKEFGDQFYVSVPRLMAERGRPVAGEAGIPCGTAPR